MEILFAASELSPTVKVGGLADVLFALSKAQKSLGHKVTLALPRFSAFDDAGILLARRLTPMVLPPHPGEPDTGKHEVVLFDGRLGSGVDLVLFDVDGLFSNVASADGKGLYDDDGTAASATKFGLFSRAVTEYVRTQREAGNRYDAVHTNDWPTAMVGYLMRLYPELADTRTVLSIHNLAHQGVFSGEAAKAAQKALGLSDAHFAPNKLEFYGGLSFLKGGLLSADAVTTVSSTYAEQILTPEHGHKLDGVLRSLPGGVIGIVNGVDYSVVNPATNPSLTARYDADDPSAKLRNKTALMAELGLELAPDRPLFVSLGRITEQKGSDTLAASLADLLSNDLSFVVAGTGDAKTEKAFAAALKRAPQRAAFLGRVPEAMTHRLLAAADFVVMPSRFEPCGLVQMQAQRYGAIPIASKTGGLIDTIVDVDADLETGTGLLISEVSASAISGAIGRALAAYRHPRFEMLQKRVMRLDLSWERPARRYARLYERPKTPTA